MATKSDKGGNNKPVKPSGETPGKTNPKARKAAEEDDDEDADEDLDIEKASAKKSPKGSAKKGKEEDDDDDDEDDVEIVDEWEKPEEEEEWDPDFEEFDLPKSKTKKVAGPTGKKSGKGEEEDDVAFDEEFKDLDLFNDSSLDEEEDDY